ncbi:MAG: AMP-binding protein, partial [Myxococcota bacterium]
MSRTNRLGRVRRDLRVVGTLLRMLSAGRKVNPARAGGYSDALAPHVRRRPDAPVLIGESGSLSWRELDELANRVAHWARAQGLGRGDIVALLMENRPEFVAIWLGLSRLGIVSALLNTNLTGERLAHCVREAAPRYWIVGTEQLEACASTLPHLEDQPALLLSGPAATRPAALEEAENLDELISALPTSEIDPALRRDLRMGDGLFLIYTSGTTGLPKAAKISHYKALITGLGSKIAQELTPRDRV